MPWAVLGVEFLLLREDLQDERRGREGEPETHHHRDRQVKACPCGDGSHQDGGDNHLSGPQPEHGPAHDPQPGGLELQTDDKQQEYDAEFGHMEDLIHVLNERQAEGSERDTGCQISQHRAETEAPEQRHCDADGDEKSDQFG
jgi:hypothetical protein